MIHKENDDQSKGLIVILVLHFLVLIEKSISAIFILRSKIKQKEREDGWTPASQSMKGPSSHE